MNFQIGRQKGNSLKIEDAVTGQLAGVVSVRLGCFVSVSASWGSQTFNLPQLLVDFGKKKNKGAVERFHVRRVPGWRGALRGKLEVQIQRAKLLACLPAPS